MPGGPDWVASAAMNRIAKIGVGLLFGFVAALVIGAIVIDEPSPVVSEGRAVDNRFPAVDHDPEAATELMAAWLRWRTATFIADGTWSRTLDAGGQPLTGPVHIVQDPPRRLVQRLGSTVELFDDAVASCEPADDGTDPVAPCVSGSSGLTYQQRVDSELALVRAYVTGESRIYDTGRGLIDGCYRAELNAAALGSPWGRWAEFCFDPASGALLSSRIRRQSAIDVEFDEVTSTVVADSDFPSG